MTGVRRILFNSLVTYGRFVCAIVCGFFTSRWLLGIFGDRDFGLFGVIGSLTVILSFWDGVLSASIGRFFSFSLGNTEDVNSKESLEDCRKWFGTAIFLYAVLAFVLIFIGYPLGCWAIREWLDVPRERMADCIKIFRFTCMNIVFAMALMPFNLMFYAKQKIAEASAYSIASLVVVFFGIWYMTAHTGDWFVGYAFFSNSASVIVSIVIAIRARCLFPECREFVSHIWSRERVVAILRVAFWRAFDIIAYVSRVHGVAVLVNKLFGPVFNASFTVANTVLTHNISLSESFGTAFTPAIINQEGAGHHGEMTQLMFLHCKLSALAYSLLAIPLLLELPYVLELWLVNPPAFVAPVCSWLLVMYFFDSMISGFGAAVTAVNRLGRFYGFIGIVNILSIVIMYMAVKFFGGTFISMFVVMAAVRASASLVCVKLADDVTNFGCRKWFFGIMLPMVMTVIISGGLAWSVRLLIETCLLRLCATTGISMVSFFACAWAVVLSEEEKTGIRKITNSFMQKFLRKRTF